MKPTYVAALACHVWQSCSATCIFNLSNVFLWIFWVAELVFIMWFFNFFLLFVCFSFGILFVFSTCKVLAWCGRCLFPAWQFGVLRVAAVRLPCGSVESCVWEGFVSDVAVWSLVRGRGSFLTWQCGVLRVARVPFWRGSVVPNAAVLT